MFSTPFAVLTSAGLRPLCGMAEADAAATPSPLRLMQVTKPNLKLAFIASSIL
jgi:hypothetical protein